MLPSKRLIILLAAIAPLFFGGVIHPLFNWLALALVALLIFLITIEIIRLLQLPTLQFEGDIPERLFLLASNKATLRIRNPSRHTLHVWVKEYLPPEIQMRPAPAYAYLRAGETQSVEYELIPQERGDFEWDGLDVRVSFAWGLLLRQRLYPMSVQVEVFPNAIQTRWHELITHRSSEVSIGMARLRRLGIGTEFESLRPYRVGDPLMVIDWKATAKHAELIARNYEDERQQTILVVLDIGRISATEFHDTSRLDVFLEATLQLAYTILRQGDRFGVLAFHEKIECYLPPVQGIKQIEQVTSTLYAIKPHLVESNYSAACHFLNLKFRKRSLICVMTDVLDKDSNSVLLQYMGYFSRRHLAMCVTVKNPDIHEWVQKPLLHTEDPYTKSAAVVMNRNREEVLTTMRRYGVDVLDVLPNQLSMKLIQRYIQIKESNRI